MHGIIVIDKPAGITSHDVVSKLRRILKTKRVGHTGTLDPFATGVMVVLVGQATRLAQFLDKDKKAYDALIRFGNETDTGDLTGARTVGGHLSDEALAARLSGIEWNGLFAKFWGEIMQTPPMYSAKKVDGEKLYELARKGVEIERKPLPVTIHELEMIDKPAISDTERRIHVVCSAGTYIRTLAEDIGRETGVGAHLAELRRTAAGKFDISMAITLDNLTSIADPVSALMPMNDAVSHLAEIRLNDERIAKTRNGLSSRIADNGFSDGQILRISDTNGALIAVGDFNDAENSVQPKIVLG